jgi:phosphate transport system substrate-binding protein
VRVVPSIATVRAAAASLPEVDPVHFSIVNAKGSDSYPIAGYTWVLLYKHYPDQKKQLALCKLFHWLETEGQRYAREIDYADLPPAVSTRATVALGPCI